MPSPVDEAVDKVYHLYEEMLKVVLPNSEDAPTRYRYEESLAIMFEDIESLEQLAGIVKNMVYLPGTKP